MRSRLGQTQCSEFLPDKSFLSDALILQAANIIMLKIAVDPC